MLDTLTNPIFWQGFIAAWLVFLPLLVLLLAATGRANDPAPRPARRAFPGSEATARVGAKGQVSRRSQMRGGPR